MTRSRLMIAAVCALLATGFLHAGEAARTKTFVGVVTYHVIPAKVIRINRIIEDPDPGTSYIGDESILVELNENVDVMANWTVVEIEYYEYPEPKTIHYEIFSERHSVELSHHACRIEVVGDLSTYIPQE
jgi:hypothetical protein